MVTLNHNKYEYLKCRAKFCSDSASKVSFIGVYNVKLATEKAGNSGSCETMDIVKVSGRPSWSVTGISAIEDPIWKSSFIPIGFMAPKTGSKQRDVNIRDCNFDHVDHFQNFSKIQTMKKNERKLFKKNKTFEIMLFDPFNLAI